MRSEEVNEFIKKEHPHPTLSFLTRYALVEGLEYFHELDVFIYEDNRAVILKDSFSFLSVKKWEKRFGVKVINDDSIEMIGDDLFLEFDDVYFMNNQKIIIDPDYYSGYLSDERHPLGMSTSEAIMACGENIAGTTCSEVYVYIERGCNLTPLEGYSFEDFLKYCPGDIEKIPLNNDDYWGYKSLYDQHQTKVA